jgi:hypothetical protein
VGFGDRTCHVCYRKYSVNPLTGDTCSLGCRRIVMNREQDARDQRRASERASRYSYSRPSYGGAGGGPDAAQIQALQALQQELMGQAAALAAFQYNALAENRESEAATLAKSNAKLLAQCRAFRARDDADERIQHWEGIQAGAARETAKRRSTADRAQQRARVAEGQAQEQRSQSRMRHDQLVEVYEDLRSWLMGLAGVEPPAQFTVQFDDPRIPKQARESVSRLLARHFGGHPHDQVRRLKRWSANNKPRRVPGGVSRDQAERLAMEIGQLGGDLRVRVVPRSEGTDDAGIGGDQDLMSFEVLRSLIDAKLKGRQPDLSFLDKEPEHPAFAELVQMCERIHHPGPVGAVKGGDNARHVAPFRDAVRALGGLNGERVLLASQTWVLTNRALYDKTGVAALGALYGLAVTEVQNTLVLGGKHWLAVHRVHKRHDVKAVFQRISKTPDPNWAPTQEPGVQESAVEESAGGPDLALMTSLLALASRISTRKIAGGTHARRENPQLVKTLGIAADETVLLLVDVSLIGKGSKGWGLTDRWLRSNVTSGMGNRVTRFALPLSEVADLSLAVRGAGLWLGPRYGLPLAEEVDAVLALFERLGSQPDR